MRSLSATGAALLATCLLVIGATACGDDEADTTPRTAEQLAASLLAPTDLTGTWTPHQAPDQAPDEASIDGVVSDEQQNMLPRMDLCDKASDSAREAVSAVQWKAFRQLDLTVDDPIDPPDDRSGHIVFAQEFLTSGDLDDITATFDQLRVGMDACLGEFPAGDEGPSTAATLVVPSVGDDRSAVLTTMDEAGGWAVWRLHQMVVREGSTLMAFLVVEIHSTDTEPLYGDDEVAALVSAAVGQL
jgi:hypothetical protein